MEGTPYIVRLVVSHTDCSLVEALAGSGRGIIFLGYNIVEGAVTHTLLVRGSLERLEELRRRGLRVEAAKTGPGSAIVMVSKKPCTLCSILYHSSDYTVLRHLIDREGRVVVKLVTPRLKTARRLASRIEARGFKILEMEVSRWIEEGPWITRRQAEVLEAALRLGYYDNPRRATLSDIARELGLSKSTVADILRRVEAKAVRLLYEMVVGPKNMAWED